VNTIAFENTYTPKPSDISVDIAVQKTVVNQGSESIGPEDFEFLLENITAQTKLSAKTNAEGKAGFTLTFSEEDIDKTVTYKLTEVNTEKEHVQYSTAEYTLTATVSLGADNKLRVALTQNGQAVNSVIAEFENVYDYTPVSVVPDNPATGDSSNPILWMALLFVSGAGLVGTTLFAKKRKEDETI